MSKAPVRRRSPAGPKNQSRGAGKAAPASAAATAPRPAPQPAAPTFYDPGDSAQDSPLAAAQPPAAPAPEREPDAPVLLHRTEEARLSADPQVLAAAEEKSPGAPEETYEQQVARIRAMRRPLGEFHLKLDIEKRRGYHTHWFNDAGARIDEALLAGWAFRSREGQRVRRAVGHGRDQGVLYAFAMDIPLEFWQEDQAARHQQATEKMEALKASPFRAPSGSAKASDSGKFYSPVEGQEPIRQEHIDHL